MTTVPNWIANAVVTNRRRTVVQPITGWRATKTQVVVSCASRQEIRFRLDDLSEFGKDQYDSARLLLVAPDDAELAHAARRRKLNHARGEVLWAIEKTRLRGGTDDLDAVLTDLETIRQAVVTAQASLADLS
jgi:hypothetical protein